jgi:hypothetical protein
MLRFPSPHRLTARCLFFNTLAECPSINGIFHAAFSLFAILGVDGLRLRLQSARRLARTEIHHFWMDTSNIKVIGGRSLISAASTTEGGWHEK